LNHALTVLGTMTTDGCLDAPTVQKAYHRQLHLSLEGDRFLELRGVLEELVHLGPQLVQLRLTYSTLY
jgi:hypothetical protein